MFCQLTGLGIECADSPKFKSSSTSARTEVCISSGLLVNCISCFYATIQTHLFGPALHERRSPQSEICSCIRYTLLDRQDVTDGRSLDTPNIAPLLCHWDQCMNPRLDRSKSLGQRRRFSIGRNHEKRSQPL